MTYHEALKKHLAGLQSLPWETSPEQATVHFLAGWEAHREALKQSDLFPGTLSNDVTPPCSHTVTADDIYAAYPRKVNPKGAKKAIQKAFGPGVHDRPEYILEKTKEFSAATKSWPANERQYIPHPQTWYNAGGWMTDPNEWVRGAAATPSQFTKKYQ